MAGSEGAVLPVASRCHRLAQARRRVLALGPQVITRGSANSSSQPGNCGSDVHSQPLILRSTEALVASASAIAEELGVSEAIIGLTIVALGTSLPELAASITCVLKGHYDLAIGNILGSNIINLLAVLPFPGLLSPGLIQAPLLFRDFAAVTLLTLLLAAFCYYAVTRGKQLGRLSGVIFLSIYCGWFTVMLVNA